MDLSPPASDPDHTAVGTLRERDAADSGRGQPAQRTRRSRRVLVARALAIVADIVQVGALPLFGAGLMSPIDEALDLAIGAALIALVGWHFAFLPTFVAELIPFVDIFPTWTAAVFFATRRKK